MSHLSHTACLESQLSAGTEPVTGMTATLEYARVRQANLAFISNANVQAVETNVIYATLTKGR